MNALCWACGRYTEKIKHAVGGVLPHWALAHNQPELKSHHLLARRPSSVNRLSFSVETPSGS